ncbi:MAG: glycosyltransferase family 2 protein, partial [Deltaproteobacteria bacterium]
MKRFDKAISVVFPAYNEEENIEICVLLAHCILKELVRDFEIIVVDDGSTDGTRQICERLEKRIDKLRVFSKKKNEGYGYALRDGFEAARFDLVFFSDSDRQFDIVNLKDLLPYIDEYDIVIGFRKKRGDSAKRKFLSWGYKMLIRSIFNIDARDIDCAFKLFRKNVFDKIRIESRYYFVNTEILAKARLHGFSIKEIGVSHFPRYEGESKVGFGDIPRTIREV